MADGMGILSGAASGAATGSAGGPAGMAIGAGLGAISAAKSNNMTEGEYHDLNRQMGLQSMWNNTQAEKSYELQKRMFDYTADYNSAANQVKRLKEAGLNPALMYGMQGAAGGTGQAGSASASGVGANSSDTAERRQAAVVERGMALQEAKLAADIRLTNAQANNLDVDAKKKEGIDTELATSMMNKVIQETTNEQVKRDLMELQKAINQNDLQQGREILNGLIRENIIGETTVNDVVKGIRAEATGKELENSKILAITNLTNEQKEAICIGLAQRWAELSVEWKNATTAERDVIVKETLRDIKEARPTTGEIKGQVIKTVFNGLYEWADKIDKKLGLDRFAPKTNPLK